MIALSIKIDCNIAKSNVPDMIIWGYVNKIDKSILKWEFYL